MRMANITEAWLYNQGYKNIHMSEWRNPASLEKLKSYCDKYYKRTIIVPSGYLSNKNILTDSINENDVERITEDNIKKHAELIFSRDKYVNSRFRAGEIIMKSFNPLAHFTNTKEKIL
jgi:hypothetical protein